MIVSLARLARFRREVEKIAYSNEGVQRGNLLPMIKHILKKRRAIVALTKKYPTPFYIFDQEELKSSINTFVASFQKYLPQSRAYYAMKVNHHPLIVETVIRRGFGIDASSGREANMALSLGAKHILLTGPGKDPAELMLAIKHNAVITLNIDSFGELKKIGELTTNCKRTVAAGVRVYTKECGGWNKFGIPLCDLKKFWVAAKKYPFLKLQGIQVHTSFNADATPYQQSIKSIADYLKKHFSKKMRDSIVFFDFGGGFQPHQSEGYYPWNTPLGELVKVIDDYNDKKTIFRDKYYISRSATMDEYAQGIAYAIKKYLAPLIRATYIAEPGHIICNNAMHIILAVADKKDGKRVILNGGINIVGWEKFEYFYFPLLNLTHPSLNEIPMDFFGNLCLPQEDVWGHYCYAKKICEGDIIMVPYQGAMTYSLAQNFIHPIPPVYSLP